MRPPFDGPTGRTSLPAALLWSAGFIAALAACGGGGSSSTGGSVPGGSVPPPAASGPVEM